MNKNCITFWLPPLQQAGLPVPKTIIVKTDCELIELCDGSEPDGWLDFLGELRGAVDEIGTPCFLRTGLGSGKHYWKNTCYLADVSKINKHVYNLVEWSETVDFMGLPSNVWAVRELLPTQPVLYAFRGDMPIVREFRFFVEGEKVVCRHPYWPEDVLVNQMPREPGADWEASSPELPDNWDALYHNLCHLSAEDESKLDALASAAGQAVGGQWSVDLLDTDRGWFVTDMAEAARSWHWPECPHKETADT